MKLFLKIVFNIVVYCTLWWIQFVLILAVFAGLGLWDPLNIVGGTPGIVGLVCFYTSYVILKQVHKFQVIKTFFTKD